MRKKINGPERRSPGTLDILTALIGEHRWLDLVSGRYPKSAALVGLIHELGADEDYNRPSIKEIAAKTGQPAVAVTKMIHQLYDGIWELNHEQPALFRGAGSAVTLYFYDRFYEASAYFTLWLEQPLHVGETFEWFFIRPKQDAYAYYVDEVRNEYRNGGQAVLAFLKAGEYNAYRKMLFDKARLLDLLSTNELYGLRDYQLDELLIHRVEKDRFGFPESLSYLDKNKY